MSSEFFAKREKGFQVWTRLNDPDPGKAWVFPFYRRTPNARTPSRARVSVPLEVLRFYERSDPPGLIARDNYRLALALAAPPDTGHSQNPGISKTPFYILFQRDTAREKDHRRQYRRRQFNYLFHFLSPSSFKSLFFVPLRSRLNLFFPELWQVGREGGGDSQVFSLKCFPSFQEEKE